MVSLLRQPVGGFARSGYLGSPWESRLLKRALSNVTILKPAEVQVADNASSETALSSGNAEQTFQPDTVELLDARALSLDFPTYMIWGANTDVGKTVVSSGLALAACQRADPLSVLYVKPVQTGFPTDCDARFVKQNASRAVKVASIYDEWKHGKPLPKLVTASLFQWEPPVSPHLAAKENPVSDTEVLTAVRTALRECKALGPSPGGALLSQQIFSISGSTEAEPLLQGGESSSLKAESAKHAVEQVNTRLRVEMQRRWVTLVETAGGVASPGPSGNIQCDLYRSLRLPGVLVGDGRLGGISATISAYETLLLRGYDTDAVVLMDSGLGNGEAIERYLQGKVPVVVLPQLPSVEEEAAGGKTMDTWLFENRQAFDGILSIVETAHVSRVARLRSMAGKAGDVLWWPFTQHGLVGTENVTVIDSRMGDEFAVYSGNNHLESSPRLGSGNSSFKPTSKTQARKKPAAMEPSSLDASPSPEAGLVNPETLNPSFDACASWWTQGVSLEGQLEITRAMAYAAGRYGHVMFPENVHEPALRLAEKLLGGVGKGWADRVFYSDNGSTAIEIAIKMAFRKYAKDHDLIGSEPFPDLWVLALRGSYHGDTLGAMEAQCASPYTGALQQPWYKGRGCFLDPPKVEYVQGRWRLRGWKSSLLKIRILRHDYATSEELFSESRRDARVLTPVYKTYIEYALDKFFDGEGPSGRWGGESDEKDGQSEDEFATKNRAVPGGRIGGLILEPVIHGAGGMELIDPLFQRVLINICKKRGIPVILDEVFAGIWRLGRETAAELLHCTPDIACYAKLLTGGMVPLAVTLATKDVYESFLGDNKLEALLHGHSYTAHATGCAAGVASLDLYTNPSKNPNYDQASHAMKEMWDAELVRQMSFLPQVTRVIALGTIFAVELRSETPGYGSLASRDIVLRLRKRGVYCRALGNVMYLMCTPMTQVDRCTQLLLTLKEEIERT